MLKKMDPKRGDMTSKSSVSVIVVTPCLNAVGTIDDTIFSVVSQSGNFDLYYHIQDGGSTDGTVERLKKWESLLKSPFFPLMMNKLVFSYATESDSGMYDALNRGFDTCNSADIMTWINADDRLNSGAIQTAVTLFGLFPNVYWLGGRHSYCEKNGMSITTLDLKTYSRKLLEMGLYEGRRLFFLQQEGIFWKRSLWSLVDCSLNSNLKLAGDFDLWRRFARHSDYVSVDSVLGVFRVRPDQATSSLNEYYNELDSIVSPFREQREIIWRQYISAPEQMGIDLSGRIIRYDGATRMWIVERRSVEIQQPQNYPTHQTGHLSSIGLFVRRLFSHFVK